MGDILGSGQARQASQG
jgi:hypothetical protein